MPTLREAPIATLEDISNEWARTHSTWGGPLSDIVFDLEAEQPLIRLGDTEIAATPVGLGAVAHHIGVPPKFIERVMPDERQWIMSRRIERSAEENIQVTYTDKGIHEVFKSGTRRIHPGDIVEGILDVMPPESTVRDALLTTNELRIDLFVPEGHALVGGDKKVGDITHGGLRIGMDRKHNLAPWVQPFLYRLICTNGMEMPDTSLKFDSRGMDESDVIMSLKAEMRRALDRVLADIEAFYDLRNQPVGRDQTGTLRRLALDAGLPERMVGRMENILPAEIDGNEDVTLFDLANVITNTANLFDPGSSSFRNLQIAGGVQINDHTARCNNCHQRVNA